jgi:hypothetical protein
MQQQCFALQGDCITSLLGPLFLELDSNLLFMFANCNIVFRSCINFENIWFRAYGLGLKLRSLGGRGELEMWGDTMYKVGIQLEIAWGQVAYGNALNWRLLLLNSNLAFQKSLLGRFNFFIMHRHSTRLQLQSSYSHVVLHFSTQSLETFSSFFL